MLLTLAGLGFGLLAHGPNWRAGLGAALLTALSSLMSSALARPPVFEWMTLYPSCRILKQTRPEVVRFRPRYWTSTKLAMLHTCREIGGDAVAYRDLDGALAWKASERMQQHFR